MDAQRIYQRLGAMDKMFRRKVRRAREDEPLDPGWRPFDPALDWTDPTLPGERWPANSEALYYWRSTYWKRDPTRTAATPTEATGGDRLVEHLRRELPETRPPIESLEWQYGSLAPHRVCRLLAEVAIEAYRNGNRDLGLRIATVLNPGLDETSEMFAPNCVAIGFLENDAWHDPAMQPFIASWPDEMRIEIRQQQAFMTQAQTEMDGQATAWSDLWNKSRGQPVNLIEDQLQTLGSYHHGYPGVELHRALTARVMSDQRWVYKHPLAALGLAWKYRRVQSPLCTLNWLRRPRFAG